MLNTRRQTPSMTCLNPCLLSLQVLVIEPVQVIYDLHLMTSAHKSRKLGFGSPKQSLLHIIRNTCGDACCTNPMSSSIHYVKFTYILMVCKTKVHPRKRENKNHWYNSSINPSTLTSRQNLIEPVYSHTLYLSHTYLSRNMIEFKWLTNFLSLIKRLFAIVVAYYF